MRFAAIRHTVNSSVRDIFVNPPHADLCTQGWVEVYYDPKPLPDFSSVVAESTYRNAIEEQISKNHVIHFWTE